MASKLLLVTPPFTQLNTPYPATAYLTGFLRSKGFETAQEDWSIELFLKVFSSDFLQKAFTTLEGQDLEYNWIFEYQEHYIEKVDTVISFLQQPTVTAAYQILHDAFLPKFHRFEQEEWDHDLAFGNLGILDKAKHYATLFIEELGDFIQGNIDDFFAFTKYAEKISKAASSFDEIEEYLNYDPTLVEEEYFEIIRSHIHKHTPTAIALSVPFPGNLFSALRAGQYIKKKFPTIKVLMGGGYCNTELRRLEDPRIFSYVDFITLDDGEGPMLRILELLEHSKKYSTLERTFTLVNQKVKYCNHIPNSNFAHHTLPAPSYEGLPLKKYLSFLDVMNPMHRMWSDGRWNKITVSHGCYWKQCSFCDVSLDYIGNYENTTAADLVNKIEQIISETGTTGFHFVDEAAPPKMLKALAKELIERGVYITWWTNIRFEKTFSFELCELLAQSGCIAVTGGLECASDRLLQKMKKGVSIEQVARVTKAFSDNNIMVHAYLMYGFPTQTEQETIDSLEIVRQLFENGCIQSAFWHLFSVTAHSPVGKDPKGFDIQITGPKFQGFAENDLEHLDKTGADHSLYTDGLNWALQNYMNHEGFDVPVQEWFECDVPPTLHTEDLILSALEN